MDKILEICKIIPDDLHVELHIENGYVGITILRGAEQLFHPEYAESIDDMFDSVINWIQTKT